MSRSISVSDGIVSHDRIIHSNPIGILNLGNSVLQRPDVLTNCNVYYIYRIPKTRPNAPPGPAWPNYRDHHKFMRFGIGREPETVVQTDFLSDRMEFWEKLTLNELGESMNDVIVSEPPEDIPTGNAIACRLSIQFASLTIIYFYI